MYSADGEYVEFGQTVLLEGPVEVQFVITLKYGYWNKRHYQFQRGLRSLLYALKIFCVFLSWFSIHGEACL